LHGVRRGAAFELLVDGEPLSAYAGETIATVLLAHGHTAVRLTPKRGKPRGLLCGMGVCFDCLVTVDGVPNVRSCVSAARPGMRVELGGAGQAVRERDDAQG
jgi:hypothetical protein